MDKIEEQTALVAQLQKTMRISPRDMYMAPARRSSSAPRIAEVLLSWEDFSALANAGVRWTVAAQGLSR